MCRVSRESIIEQTLNGTINNQDFMQRVYMTMNVSLELYRMLVSTLLIISVPQNCDGHLCSFKENLVWQDPVYDTSLTFNFITLCAFLILYGVEIVRENRMISYLEVNPENPRDNKSMTTIFENLPPRFREEIYSIDSLYKKTSYACVFVFMINTILSGITIYKYNYGNQTTSTFITNVLFMITKVYYTYYVANTDKSVFYSAYLHDRIQYNDIDPKIKTDIETGSLSLCKSLGVPQHYVQLREPDEFLIHEINESDPEFFHEVSEDVIKEYAPATDDADADGFEIDYSLGFPLELPRQTRQIELEIEFPIGKPFIDLPDEVGPEDPNKEVVDLIRQSVKEVLADIRKRVELRDNAIE